MNFGTGGSSVLFFMLLAWALPFILAIWFIKTLTSIARSLSEMVERLASLERTIRDRPR